MYVYSIQGKVINYKSFSMNEWENLQMGMEEIYIKRNCPQRRVLNRIRTGVAHMKQFPYISCISFR